MRTPVHARTRMHTPCFCVQTSFYSYRIQMLTSQQGFPSPPSPGIVKLWCPGLSPAHTLWCSLCAWPPASTFQQPERWNYLPSFNVIKFLGRVDRNQCWLTIILHSNFFPYPGKVHLLVAPDFQSSYFMSPIVCLNVVPFFPYHRCKCMRFLYLDVGLCRLGAEIKREVTIFGWCVREMLTLQ